VAEREAALVAERARAESILRSLDEGLCLLDARGRVAYANPRLGQLLGRATGELIGRPAGRVLADMSSLVAEPRRVGRRVIEALRRRPNIVRTRTMIVLSVLVDRPTALPG